jgi:ATP-dependent exoDNAse (exonuclease V) alpha subunit
MPRDSAIIFDDLIGQTRRAPDCGKFGRSIFRQVLAAQMPPTFSMGVHKCITAAWAEQKVVREIMVFLHSHGVGTARAVRIYKTYGSDAVQVMSENPYRLARDIRGIGFKTADAIAMKLGINKIAMVRVRAGISYALTEAMHEGHCGLPVDDLGPLAEKLLEVPQELVRTALELELADGAVIADTLGDKRCVFLAGCTGQSAASPSGCCSLGPASCPGPRLIRRRRFPGSSSGPAWYSPARASARRRS